MAAFTTSYLGGKKKILFHCFWLVCFSKFKVFFSSSNQECLHGVIAQQHSASLTNNKINTHSEFLRQIGYDHLRKWLFCFVLQQVAGSTEPHQLLHLVKVRLLPLVVNHYNKITIYFFLIFSINYPVHTGSVKINIALTLIWLQWHDFEMQHYNFLSFVFFFFIYINIGLE